MSSGQVIKAAQMFKKAGQGNSANVNLKYEMAMGMSLGIVVGLGWKVTTYALDSTVALLMLSNNPPVHVIALCLHCSGVSLE